MIKKIKNELHNGKNFIKFSLINIFGQFFGLLVSLILAKFLNPLGFGTYSLSLMLIALFSALLISSSQTPFIIYANQEKQKTGKLNKSFSTQIIFFGISSFLFVLIILLLGDPISTFVNLDKTLLLFLVLAFLGISINSLLSNLFLALDKKNESALVIMINSILILLFIFILFYIHLLSLKIIFLIYFSTGIITFLIFLKRIDLKLLFPLRFDKVNFYEQWNFTKWQVLGFVAVYLINWGDNFVLRYFVSIDQIGVYNLAYKLFMGFISLTFIINSYFLPFVSKNLKNKDKIKEYLTKKRIKTLILGIVLLFVFCLIMPKFILKFYSDKFEKAAIVFLLLSPGALFALLSVFYLPLFNSTKKYKFVQLSNGLQVILNISLDLLLIPLLGILGAALATSLAYFLRYLTNEAYFRFVLKKEII